ncbi:citrate synthase [Ornithobacterium rhinotracheale]|uniref:Citrate synthase n=1 Tax=Ornithobacterium rhinotracheale (strain ATCC 51463 / DSM 15997 / CCUG 23171 / CIP 104009 / LMG 9086) TaxID=867902 RepID=I3ZY68_ORNRL|nr:citrate synthase [Ornithobacterium rhinotracheale]AFL96652.1 citrate synthase I, hexameric type [Ornithobacterium rhinotracheale DSM 15997]AIP99551.1 type II citrate synthase [Ornithobacterium rhinotracheale ORT-UMN 88]KGB66557.1 type II citrate synthase [Ornithobacterium rhinotracheale H06-030791]MBN3662564.1 citrate synthase [Ornithobacterium rhinotracheale]MCK0194001.1 citrate synthase [Ornithobacterium rhinotracheale]
MSETVKIIYQGKEYEYPIIEGTMGDKGIDISSLRNDSGLITLDPGYKNTGATISKITYLDGEEGKLLYRGYPIEQLAEKSTFVEVMYLLLYGELPNREELTRFKTSLNQYNFVNDRVRKILEGFPSTAHPMGVLSSLTGSLTAFNPRVVDVTHSADMFHAATRLLAKMPILASWTYRLTKGLELNEPDLDLGYVANFYKMMFKKKGEAFELNDVIIDALDKLLIIHADHEQNCSTSTVRLVGSSHAGLFSSVSAGISALWGPRHGGANQAVIEMLETIKADGGGLHKWVDKAKDKDDEFRLMGFGHRVYKNMDPRAKIIKKAADDVLEQLGIHDEILNIAKGLEEVALNDEYFIERKLYPNVDFYSGIIYQALGIPKEMFTAMFAVGRLPGWISQWKEMRETHQPIGRPRQVYTGATTRDYVSLDER